MTVPGPIHVGSMGASVLRSSSQRILSRHHDGPGLARVFHVEQRRQTVPQCTGHGPTSLGETHCAQTHVERPMSSAGTVMHVDELLSGAGSRQCTPVPRSAP